MNGAGRSIRKGESFSKRILELKKFLEGLTKKNDGQKSLTKKFLDDIRQLKLSYEKAVKKAEIKHTTQLKTSKNGNKLFNKITKIIDEKTIDLGQIDLSALCEDELKCIDTKNFEWEFVLHNICRVCIDKNVDPNTVYGVAIGFMDIFQLSSKEFGVFLAKYKPPKSKQLSLVYYAHKKKRMHVLSEVFMIGSRGSRMIRDTTGFIVA
eukprot:UN04986